MGMVHSTRLATMDDRPAIDAFADATVHDAYDSLVDRGYAQTLLDFWWGDALDEDVRAGRILVATRDGRVIGLTQLGDLDGEPVMWKLYVAPGHRGDGVGAQLMRDLIRVIPPRSPRLVTEHIACNEGAARFYAREGFGIIGTDQHDDPRLSVVWRARAIERPRRRKGMRLRTTGLLLLT